MHATRFFLRTVRIGVLCAFAISACGPSAADRTATSVAETAAAASPTPTQTTTPTPTQTMTPLPTSTPTPSMADIYDPMEENTVWWYTVSLNDKFLRMSSFTVLGTETLNDTQVTVIEMVESGIYESWDYLELTPEWHLLHRFVSQSAQGQHEETIFQPPMPLLHFPIEIGDAWEYSAFTYKVAALEDISVPAGDYENCYRVDRVFGDVTDFRSWYCQDIGRPVFEHLTDLGWMRLELLVHTTARLQLDEVMASNGSCGYLFSGQGFRPDEDVTFRVYRPDNEVSFDTGDLGLPIKASDNFSFTLGSEDPHGLWPILLEGTEHTAFYFLYWMGECIAY